MFVLGHLGIGSWLAARRVSPQQIGWLLFGALLPDLVDKPLYYALVLATGRRAAELGLISGTRTLGHTLLFAIALWAVLPRRIGWPLALGIATHLLLDEMGDLVGFAFPGVVTRHPGPSTLSAILFPLLGPHFPISPFRNARDHAASIANAYIVACEVLGAALLYWQWRRGVLRLRAK
jgi:hypothetical protein